MRKIRHRARFRASAGNGNALFEQDVEGEMMLLGPSDRDDDPDSEQLVVYVNDNGEGDGDAFVLRLPPSAMDALRLLLAQEEEQ